MRLAELLRRQGGHLLRRQGLQPGGFVRQVLNLFGCEVGGLGEQGHEGAVLEVGRAIRRRKRWPAVEITADGRNYIGRGKTRSTPGPSDGVREEAGARR